MEIDFVFFFSSNGNMATHKASSFFFLSFFVVLSSNCLCNLGWIIVVGFARQGLSGIKPTTAVKCSVTRLCTTQVQYTDMY